MNISTLIPAESHIACQRQGVVIIDPRGVVCLVKNNKVTIELWCSLLVK